MDPMKSRRVFFGLCLGCSTAVHLLVAAHQSLLYSHDSNDICRLESQDNRKLLYDYLELQAKVIAEAIPTSNSKLGRCRQWLGTRSQLRPGKMLKSGSCLVAAKKAAAH